jgi:hypothetical protein
MAKGGHRCLGDADGGIAAARCCPLSLMQQLLVLRLRRAGLCA